MNAKEFFYAVAEMRSAQREYFSTKSQKVLVKSKILEKQIDLEIERVKAIIEANPAI